MTVIIHERKPMDISGAMVVVAIPTVGLVGPIVGQYLTAEMKLEFAGSIYGHGIHPAALVSEGKPYPPVRIYMGKKVCGPDRKCDQMVVITTEFPVAAEATYDLATALIDWCARKGADTVAAVEGIASTEKPAKPRIYGVASTKSGLNTLKSLGVETLGEGVIQGLSGVLLTEGERRDVNVLCLLAEAFTAVPDARAAAELIHTMDEMLPKIEINIEPLLKQAESIETVVRERLHAAAAQKKASEVGPMFG